MARKKTNPPSATAQFLLPVELIERIAKTAQAKTFGNKSRTVIEILEGRMTLVGLEEEGRG